MKGWEALFTVMVIATALSVSCLVFMYFGKLKQLPMTDKFHNEHQNFGVYEKSRFSSQVRRYVIAELIGRLGNNLWIYSSLYAIGKRTKRTPILCAKYNYINKVFPCLSPIIYPTRKCQKLLEHNHVLHLRENSSWHFDTSIISMLTHLDNSYIYLYGFFQNLRYFSDHIHELKKHFLINAIYKKQSESFMQGLREHIAKERIHQLNEQNLSDNSHFVFVCIHVRRGDMLRSKHVNIPGTSYFNHSMAYFRKRYGANVLFVVTTDDLRWSKHNLKGYDIYFTKDFGIRKPAVDLAIAISCNHTIMSVGTFGWWLGYLTGGEVIYFKEWFRDYPQSLYTQDEYFPHHYKPMD